MQRIIFTVFLLCLFVSETVNAQKCHSSPRHDEIRKKLGKNCLHKKDRFNCLDIIQVTDGDTISINIPNLHPYFGANTAVRLSGLDTPESRPPTVKCLPLPSDHTAMDIKDHENCLAAKRLRKCEIDASKEATALLNRAVCVDSDRVDVQLNRDVAGRIEREKFGRVLGRVQIINYQGNGRRSVIDAQKILLDKRLAFHYDGGTKATRDWCRKTVVKKPQLQIKYVRKNFCAGRKCTERTRMKRCFRKSGFAQQVGCYQQRVADNVESFLRSCIGKSGESRKECFRSKANGYLHFCTLFGSLDGSRECRSAISRPIEKFCNGLRGEAAEVCLASII